MSISLKINKPLVSVNWLHQNIEATNLIVLNGTLPKVALKSNEIKTEESQIPNTRFFDIKKVFSIQGAQFPNAALEPKDFEIKARELGVNKDSFIVVYDEHGIYSAPRVWWLFKTMGFDNVAVLDGGFPAWKNAGYAAEKKQDRNFDTGNLTVNYNPRSLINSDTVLDSLNNTEKQIVDARSSGRFYATVPEPRAEIRSGHIPNSKNLPYSVLVSGGKLKSKATLEILFNEVSTNSNKLIFSCGSGITACVLALGATIAGYDNLAVYDGSWTEWGSLPHLPIEK
jgi:thiosulfate/3-mercaptopyruvate sulfurtransferase